MEISRGYVFEPCSCPPSPIHDDLSGPKDNILIDHNGRACLADFSLITVVSDRSTFLASCIEGGTTRWMSPELFDPDKFGLKESRPTKESDCYALGMVIYEVLSGRKPYGACKAPVVIRKVLAGERPGRPQGNEGKLFTASIWKVVQLCWRPRPGDRTTAETVLLGLKGDAISSDCSMFFFQFCLRSQADPRSLLWHIRPLCRTQFRPTPGSTKEPHASRDDRGL